MLYMGKHIFYELNQLQNYSRITIKQYAPVFRDKVLINTEPHEGRHNGYYTVIQDTINQSEVRMYYRASKNDSITEVLAGQTCLAISYDYGLSFTKPVINNSFGENNIILQGVATCHNFTPCLYNSIYLAIGGAHIIDTQVEELDDQSVKDMKRIKMRPYMNDSNGTYFIYSGDVETDKKVNGLHLYKSSNGLDWELVNNKPIISGLFPGQTDRLRGFSNFDSHLAFFYHPYYQKYFLYCRANVTVNLRFIQYTTSTDLINWEPLKLINLDPMPYKNLSQHMNENYYIPGINPYPDSHFFIGFTPYFCYGKQLTGIYLLLSNDGYNFKRMDLMISGESLKGKLPNMHSVNGLVLSENKQEYYLYIQDGYWRMNGLPNEIWRYSIQRDRFTSIWSEAGYFSYHMLLDNQYLKINYRTWNNGNLIIEFYQNDLLIQNNILNGDELDQELKINNGDPKELYLIKIILNKAEVFCLSN